MTDRDVGECWSWAYDCSLNTNMHPINHWCHRELNLITKLVQERAFWYDACNDFEKHGIIRTLKEFCISEIQYKKYNKDRRLNK